MTLDSDMISDTLNGVADVLIKDHRTAALALRLDDIRRDVVRALSTIEPPRRALSEADRQAREQGGADRVLLPYVRHA